MKKPINEQFLKMQKIAGVITESQYVSKLNEMGMDNDLEMDRAWKALDSEIKKDLIASYTDDGDAKPFMNLSLGEMPEDMSAAIKAYINEPFADGNPNAYTDDIYNYSGEMEDFPFDTDDDTFYESKKTKMTKTKLKEAIRKEIMAALTEDGEMLGDEKDLGEAKKDEEEEEIALDAEDTETEDTADDAPADDSMGSGGSTDEVQRDLTAALNSAKELGDKKLVRQIGNALTYFTRQQISTEEV